MRWLVFLIFAASVAFAQTSFVGGQRSIYVYYIEWVESQGNLQGRYILSMINGRGPYSINQTDSRFVGTRTGSQVILNFARNEQLLASLVGGQFVFNETATDGSLIRVALSRGGVREYNTFLETIRVRVNALNQVYEAQQTALRNQQQFDAANTAVRRGFSRLDNVIEELRQKIDYLQSEVNRLPAIVTEMETELDNMRGNFEEVKGKTSPDMSCYTRDFDLNYGVNNDMAYNANNNLAYGLNNNMAYQQGEVERARRDSQAVIDEARAAIRGQADLLAALKQALQRHPKGSATYRQTEADVQSNETKVNRLIAAATAQMSQNMAKAQQHQKEAEVIYQKGQRLLAEARKWLVGAQKLECEP